MNRDRISDLPDSILGHILSFIDTESAIGTTVLSKRWKNVVWISLSTLHFNDLRFHRFGKFVDFVKNVIKRRDRTLSLSRFIYISRRTEYTSKSTAKFIEKLIGYVATENLKYLQLSMPSNGFDLIPADPNLKSLICLKLRAVCYSNASIPAVGSLPQLEILHLDGFELFDDSNLLSSCKKLVELSIIMSNSNKQKKVVKNTLLISAPRLVRLKITYGCPKNTQSKEITLELPQLVFFTFKSCEGIPDFRTDEFLYLKVAKVKLTHFTRDVGVEEQKKVLNMLQKLCHARNLTLSLLAFEHLYKFSGALEDVSIPPFSNLKTLTISTKERNIYCTNKNYPILNRISVNVINKVLNAVFQNSDVEHFIDLPRPSKQRRL